MAKKMQAIGRHEKSAKNSKKVKDQFACDETTDISNHVQLLFYCRFIDRKRFLEEILFLTSLETTNKAIDIFSAVEDFLVINELPWEKVIGICTDGAPAMTGCRSGFMELVKKKNPRIIGSHCIIHRQALVSQTLPERLNVTLNLAIKIVNHIKSSALNTRLFQALRQELNSDQETLLCHTEVSGGYTKEICLQDYSI
ncbi:protein FAM200C-like [Diabrotica undecimpunctata]|uniref:protein FAM200C-like n=1 Tax=Diabrotica undecimpunctata TaxID=50387 RepID=UPI003B634CED